MDHLGCPGAPDPTDPASYEQVQAILGDLSPSALMRDPTDSLVPPPALALPIGAMEWMQVAPPPPLGQSNHNAVGAFHHHNPLSHGYFGASDPSHLSTLFPPLPQPTALPGMAYTPSGQLSVADLARSSAYNHDSLSPDPSESNAAQGRDGRPHRRGYQACQRCRERKVKCDLGSMPHPSPRLQLSLTELLDQVSMRRPNLHANGVCAKDCIVNLHPPERNKRDPMGLQEMCRKMLWQTLATSQPRAVACPTTVLGKECNNHHRPHHRWA